MGPKVPAGSIFGCVNTPKRLEERLEHVVEWENAFHTSLSELQQLGGTLDQNSCHTIHPQGHGGPIGPKERTGSYPPQLSVWLVRPTHLNVEGGDSYPPQLSVWPVRPTHLNVEGGDFYPPHLPV